MRVINKTKWETNHLKAILNEIATQRLEPQQRKRLTVLFVPARKYVSGCARLGSPSDTLETLWFKVRVPNGYNKKYPLTRDLTDKMCTPMKASIAHVIAHEIAHCNGSSGERWMRSKHSKLSWHSVKRGDWDWANELPLEFSKPKPRPTKTYREKACEQLQYLDRKIKEWETKEKRAKMYLKKYKKQKMYYQDRLNNLD